MVTVTKLFNCTIELVIKYIYVIPVLIIIRCGMGGNHSNRTENVCSSVAEHRIKYRLRCFFRRFLLLMDIIATHTRGCVLHYNHAVNWQFLFVFCTYNLQGEFLAIWQGQLCMSCSNAWTLMYHILCIYFFWFIAFPGVID